VSNRITTFMHCRQCIKEMPPGHSPREWARLECGWTKEGWQVWCVRHDRNVTDIDLQGQKVVVLPDSGGKTKH